MARRLEGLCQLLSAKCPNAPERPFYNFPTQSFLRDLRFGLRLLRKDIAFTVGAGPDPGRRNRGDDRHFNSSGNALLLKPFPYRDPQQQLVSLQVKGQTKDLDGTLMRYELLRDRAQSFQSVAAFTNDTFNLTGHGDPVQVAVGRVSPNFFGMLGVEPQLGRTFAEDARPA